MTGGDERTGEEDGGVSMSKCAWPSRCLWNRERRPVCRRSGGYLEEAGVEGHMVLARDRLDGVSVEGLRRRLLGRAIAVVIVMECVRCG